MQFVNNYLRPVTLAAGATSLALDLPDGEYRLTLNSGDLYEIVGAVVMSGTATLVRGLEGTAVRGWESGSVIFCDVTAGWLEQIDTDLEAAVATDDPRLSDSRTPTGGAGGVLSGSYPNPGFAVDMATQAELDAAVALRIPLTQKGAPNGVGTLDNNGKQPLSEVSDAVLGQVEYKGTWNAATNTPELPTVPVKRGDYYVTSTGGTQFGLTFEVGDWIISDGTQWDKVDNTDAVQSVQGRAGAVVITKADLSIENVDNTSDLNKPVSTAQQAALDLKADASSLADVATSGAAADVSITDAGNHFSATNVEGALQELAEAGGGASTAIPQNSQSTAYTLVLSDAGKHILHPSADTTARTFTIPANSSVAFAVGTVITFVNQNAAGVLTIVITTDTMRLAGAGTTGSRTLAANGVATAIKLTSTEWIISGVGLT